MRHKTSEVEDEEIVDEPEVEAKSETWLPIDGSSAGWMHGDVAEVRSTGNPPTVAHVTRTRVYDRANRVWATGTVWHGPAGKLMFTPTEYRVIP